LISLIIAVRNAADTIFAQTPTERANIIFHRPLDLCHQVVLDVKDGSQNVWTDLATRSRGDRRDQRRIRVLKDQAARSYKLLTGLGASAEEAVETVNWIVQSHAKMFRLKLPRFTAGALRERDVDITVFDVKIARSILAKCPPHLVGVEAGNLEPEERIFLFKPVARQMMSEALDNVVFVTKNR
jgi:hypothetical protein